jgi:glycosyltransferase involved in cell wall biosynthesis
MLTGQDIIYIANDWARENKTSAHQIAEVLSLNNRVLYVEAAGMRRPRATGRDFRKIIGKLRKLTANPERLRDNLYLYSPFVLPFHRYGVVRALNRRIIPAMLGRASRHLGFENPLIWIFMPHYAGVLDRVKNKGIIYYCVDEYSSQPNVDAEMISLMEREILRRADAVFAVSQELVESKQRFNAHTYLSPHGVDVELFRKAMDEATTVPEDIRHIPRPIAGYFGLLEEWTDVDLIDYLATSLPGVSFVFIGRVVADVGRLLIHENVHFLGKRRYETLPNYLKAFDACMLLYKSGEFARHANPKKLREYLAGGKPVVSVRLREVERFTDVVYLADSYDDFARLLRKAISEDNKELARRRISAVSSQSWQSRVSDLGDIILERLPALRSTGPEPPRGA